MNLKRYYDMLEVDETASIAEIKQAYRDLIAIWHPDRHARNPRLHEKATEKMKELNTAYDLLMTHRQSGNKAGAGNTRADEKNPGHLMMECSHCGASNRVKLLHLKMDPKCGKCGRSLLEGQHKRSSANGSSGKDQDGGFRPRSARPFRGKAAKKRKRPFFIWLLVILVAGLASMKLVSEWSGEKLFGSLDSLLATAHQGPAAVETAPDEPFKTIQLDPERIVGLQQSLLVLGYDSGPIDGKMGAKTIEAARRFAADFQVNPAKNSIENLIAQAARQAAITENHPDWPDIVKASDFNLWIENQAISSPDICREIKASGTPEQVTNLVNGYKFDRLGPSPVTLPATGIQQKSFYKGMAPLKIKTRDEGRHYYIKLVTVPDGKQIFTALIRSGGVLTVHVPLGTYELKYAIGKDWYGPQWLFGSDTVFSRLDREFEFNLKQNEISGYSIDLYLKALPLSDAHRTYAFDF